eukprot:COSAG05_NODE_2653_length_2799_cov_5.095556_1_plen_66_part_00
MSSQSMIMMMNRLKEPEHTSAAQKILLLQSFLLGQLNQCSDHRRQLQAAFQNCDEGLLRELIPPA